DVCRRDAAHRLDQRGEAGHPAARLPAPDGLYRLLLSGIGTVVDVDRHLRLRTGPEVAGEGAQRDHAEAGQVDGPVAALVDVPGQDAFAGVVGWRLREGARAWDVALADIEPIALGAPLRNVSHDRPLHLPLDHGSS